MTVEDPFIQWGTVNVGLGHVQADREAADSRHERVCTYLVVPAPARRVVSAAVRDEGALRMRHTPCGCAPYGEDAFHIRRARPLGVPTAKRQTVQGNGAVRTW